MAVEFLSRSEADTERLGEWLAERLPLGSVVALSGTLGAGKTRLTQAVAMGLGIACGTVVSPTFVLRQEYQGRKALIHYDAYRLRDEDEFRELGVEECFESPALTFVEWADRVATAMPEELLRIEIEVVGTMERRFVVSAVGKKYAPLMEGLRAYALEWGAPGREPAAG